FQGWPTRLRAAAQPFIVRCVSAANQKIKPLLKNHLQKKQKASGGVEPRGDGAPATVDPGGSPAKGGQNMHGMKSLFVCVLIVLPRIVVSAVHARPPEAAASTKQGSSP